MAWIDRFLEDQWYGEGNRLGSLAITVPSGLSNSMLLAICTGRSTSSNPEYITGFTWQGSGFTADWAHQQYDANQEGEFYLWYLLNPAAAGPANVTMTYALARNHDTLLSVVLLKNVVQQAPIGNVYASSGGASKTTSGILCAVNDLVFHMAGIASINIGSRNVGSGETEGHYDTYSDTQNSTHWWAYKRATSTSENMEFTWTNSNDYGIGGFAIATHSPSGNRAFLIASKIQDFYDELKKGLIPPDLLQKRYKELFI